MMTRWRNYICMIGIALSLVACKSSQTISNKENSKTSNRDAKSIKKNMPKYYMYLNLT